MRELVDSLEALLLRPEGEHIEFKEAKNRYDFEELAKYCVALANERGGTIVLGVSDKVPHQVVGTQAFLNLGRTKAAIASRIHLRVDADEVNHPDGRVVLFRVPSRPIGMPVHYEGQYFMRSGEELVPMLPEVLARIFDESGPDYSAETIEGATLDDLDRSALEDFRRRWAAKSRNDKLMNLSIDQLLADAELMGGGNLTLAALILFGTHAALGKHLAQAEVIFEYRSSDASGPAQVRTEYRQGFFSFYDDLWSTINLRNDLQHFQSGFFMMDVPTFNERAVREAILNAISHRDYRMAGSVFIRQYPKRIEIVSPGGLPAGITFENILHEQLPRNRRLAEAFSRCGLVERSGQGMNLMYESCIRESKAEPDFSRSDPYHVWLTLHGEMKNPEFLRVLESIGKERVNLFSTDDLIVIDRVFAGRAIPGSCGYAVNRLLEEGIIEKNNRGRFLLSRRFYASVKKSGVYTRKKGLDRETNKELLAKHIRESGAEGARMQEFLQVLPSLTRSRIQVLLRELSRDGRIHVHGHTSAARWFTGTSCPTCNQSDDEEATS